MKKVCRPLLWLLPLGWAGLIFYLSSQSSPVPFQVEPSWLGLWLSKLGHVVIFGVLAFLVVLAAGWKWYGYLIALVVVVAYAGFDEYHQAFTPERYPSVVDVLIDGVGGLLALALSYFIFGSR